MEPFPVVEQLDVPENGLPHVFDVLEVTPVGQRKSLLDLYFCASIMPDHKQACVGRNSRLVDFSPFRTSLMTCSLVSEL